MMWMEGVDPDIVDKLRYHEMWTTGTNPDPKMLHSFRLAHEVIEKAARERMEQKQNYCATYLAATGADVTALTLCEQSRYEDGQYITRYWLEPKDHRNPAFGVDTGTTPC